MLTVEQQLGLVQFTDAVVSAFIRGMPLNIDSEIDNALLVERFPDGRADFDSLIALLQQPAPVSGLMAMAAMAAQHGLSARTVHALLATLTQMRDEPFDSVGVRKIAEFTKVAELPGLNVEGFIASAQDVQEALAKDFAEADTLDIAAALKALFEGSEILNDEDFLSAEDQLAAEDFGGPAEVGPEEAFENEGGAAA